MRKLAKKLVVWMVPAAMVCTGVVLTASDASAKAPEAKAVHGKKRGKKRGKFKKFLEKLKKTALWAKWGPRLEKWRNAARAVLKGCRAKTGIAKQNCRKKAKGEWRANLKTFKTAWKAFRAKRLKK